MSEKTGAAWRCSCGRRCSAAHTGQGLPFPTVGALFSCALLVGCGINFEIIAGTLEKEGTNVFLFKNTEYVTCAWAQSQP